MGRSLRVLAALAGLVMALAGLAGLGGAGMVRAASVAVARPGSVSGSQDPIPYGGSSGQSGVTVVCFDATGYSCTGGGYNGTAAQIDGGPGGWSSGTYWSWGSPGPTSGTKHNCTTYAAYRIQYNGYAYPHWYGNAYQWAANAAGAGTEVDQTPAVGAIAQWNGVPGATDGHVAYVEAVTATYIETTSDSYDGGTDHLRIARTSPYMPDNFIHFQDTHIGEIVQWNDDPSRPQAAWRVGSDTLRHWIPTESVYECLVNGTYGANGPFEMPASWLDSVAKLDPGSTVPCGGDINGDGIVNIKDLSLMAAQYGHSGPGLTADINLDGTVSLSDLVFLAQQWNKKPWPTPIDSADGSGGVAADGVTMGTVHAEMWSAVRHSTPLVRPAVAAEVARPAQADGAGDVEGNDNSVDPSVSADGNLVAFSSFATNLVPDDENGSTLDVFVWNRSTGAITLADTQANGTQFTTPSTDPHISPNGRYAAFDSGGDVWVKDLQTGALLRITQPNADTSGEPDEPAYADAVTSSGLVIFDSEATNLVSAVGLNSSVMQVYARQLTDSPIQLVSVAPDGATAAGGNSFGGNASDDGRYVVFSSLGGNLTAGDTSGYSGVFERDLTTGTTTMLSVPRGGGQANGYSVFPSISADGSAVAFSSTATNLTAGSGPSGVQQVYVVWPAIGAIYQASQAANGIPGNEDSTEPSISGNGTRVAFTSEASNLVPGDTNYSDNVYVRDLSAGVISRVSVSASLAQANNSSFGPSINGNGNVVTFPSFASNLGPATSEDTAASASAAPVEQIVTRDITLLPQNPATVTISGTVKVGATLTSHAGTWQTQGGTLSYQWYANGAAIKAATRKTLTLTAAQYRKVITVTVTSSLTGFARASATSRPTVKVAAGTLTPVTPTIKGTARAGDTLTVVAGAWKPAGVTLHYQWYVAGKAVSNGTGRTLKLSKTWVGRTVTVKVTGTLAGYATVTVSSKPTGEIGG